MSFETVNSREENLSCIYYNWKYLRFSSGLQSTDNYPRSISGAIMCANACAELPEAIGLHQMMVANRNLDLQ